jgi:transposase
MHLIKYIGVDLCKLELVADLAAEAKPRAFPNDVSGHAALIAVLPKGAHLVCESTGGYQRALVAALHAAQVPVSVVSPARVRHFARAKGLRAKTDPIDARLLSVFGEAMGCVALSPPSAEALELQALVRARQVLHTQLNEESSHDEHCTVPFLLAQAAARRTLLLEQICAIERRLRALIAANPFWHARSKRVQEVSGIGEVSAWIVLAELPELGQLAPGQAGALLGVAPDPNESGPRHGPRHISGGRSHARKVFYMAALTASRHNSVLAPFYLRLTQQHHKHHRVALTAVMRKLVELLNRLLADPNFMLAP